MLEHKVIDGTKLIGWLRDSSQLLLYLTLKKFCMKK